MKPSSKAMTSTPGNFFGGSVAVEFSRPRTVIFFSENFEPVRMNLEPGAGACGATIFWKHVGQSMTLPPCDASHIMCWPQTGQAYLNSLINLWAKPFHRTPVSAMRIFGKNAHQDAKAQSKKFFCLNLGASAPNYGFNDAA